MFGSKQCCGSDFDHSNPDPTKVCYLIYTNKTSHLIETSSDTQNKDKNIILPKLYFKQYYKTRKIDLQGSGLRIQIRIRVTQKDWIRQDRDP